MKKIITVLAIAILIFACSSKKEGNMTILGKIKGLKKGSLYLQKMNDTVLISIDSIAILGEKRFKLSGNIDSPELFFLTFKGSNTKKRILFFGEKGIITINDNIDNFGLNPEITGSKNQEILNKFDKINKQFRNQRLDLIQQELEAKKIKDEFMLKKLDEGYKKLFRRKVLFAANFAISNSNFEVSPYIGLTELYNANIKLLDTLNNSLSEKVKKSTYGKRFNTYVTNIKKSEGSTK